MTKRNRILPVPWPASKSWMCSGDDKEKTLMQKFIDTLEKCVQQSTFVSDRIGRISPQHYKQLYDAKGWNNTARMLLWSSKLEIDNRHVEELAEVIKLVVAEFLHTKTGRLGNGLFLLMRGSSTWAYPTVTEFSRMLITGAVRFGASDVSTLLIEWVRGEPLRYQTSALLEGVHIDEPLQLDEGVFLSKLPKSAADFPASLPFFEMAVPVIELLGGIVMSIDCEMSPSLYLPDEDELGQISYRKGEFTMASSQIPNLTLENFCESMSLACNGHVDWFIQWRDFGLLEAFSSMLGGFTHKPLSGSHGTKISQVNLCDSLKIHQARYECERPRENLELAIRRWIRSKKSSTDMDKLIELRIALEALYKIEGLNEKGFRIATYGAWHLGGNFDQRREIRETLRKTYSDSSSAVHGGKLKYAIRDPNLVSSAQDICRNGILKRLKESDRPEWDDVILGAGN